MYEDIAYQIISALSVILSIPYLRDLDEERRKPIEDRNVLIIIVYLVMSTIFLSIAIHFLKKVFCGC